MMFELDNIGENRIHLPLEYPRPALDYTKGGGVKIEPSQGLFRSGYVGAWYFYSSALYHGLRTNGLRIRKQ